MAKDRYEHSEEEAREEFDGPPQDEDADAAELAEGEESAEAEAGEPSAEIDDEEGGPQAAAAADVFEAGAPDEGGLASELSEAHARLSELLAERVGAEASAAEAGALAAAFDAEDFAGPGNIQGVGIGFAERDLHEGPAPGDPALNVYVAEPVTLSHVRGVAAEASGLSLLQDESLPVNIIPVGVVEAQPHRFRIRPAPGGVSCSHFRLGGSGTLGCLARGRSGRRRRRKLILSNNHVIANSNDARFGDSIVQPGVGDGGVNPRDRIAILERFVPIDFGGGANFVDCATGWAWPKKVRRELVYVAGGRPRFFRVGSRPVRCRRGLVVGKSGRTTQLTAGRILDCNVTIRVSYGAGRVALFRDQMSIRGLRRLFSAPGDSGSLIWTWNRRRNPVGLLFAGGGGLTFANKIGRVLNALDIRLYT